MTVRQSGPPARIARAARRATSPYNRTCDEPQQSAVNLQTDCAATSYTGSLAAVYYLPSTTETSVTRSTIDDVVSPRTTPCFKTSRRSRCCWQRASGGRPTRIRSTLDDDRLESSDVSTEDLLGFGDPDAAGRRCHVSLDALQRERKAIDAALSQLHDVKSDTADAGQDAARVRRSAESRHRPRNRGILLPRRR